MPISQYTQPAQGTYEPMYQAPPFQEIGSIAGKMQQEQDVQRQAAQQFVSGLGSGQVSTEEAAEGATGQALGVQGGDVPIARAKAEQAKAAINQLAEESGYNLRSPQFKSKFQNLRGEVLSDPYWQAARGSAKRYEDQRERLRENYHNLPAWRVDQLRNEMQTYERFGSVDPRTGEAREFPFSSVPSETPDVEQWVNDTLLGDITDTTTGRFKSGITVDKAANMAGLEPVRNDEDQIVDYEVSRMPSTIQSGTEFARELEDQARYIAEQNAAESGEDLTREDVNEIKRGLYKDIASRAISRKAHEDIDWSEARQWQQMQEEAGADSALGENVMHFMSRFAGVDPSTGESSSPVATFDERAVDKLAGVDDNGMFNISDYTRDPRGREEESVLVTNMAQYNPEKLGEITDQVNTYRDVRNKRSRLESVARNLTEEELKKIDKEEGIRHQYSGIPQESTRASSPVNSAIRSLAGLHKEVSGEEEPTEVFDGKEYTLDEALLSDELSPTKKHTFITRLKRDIKENLDETEKSLPKDIGDKAEEFNAIKKLGQGIKQAGGEYRFDPRTSENKITTSDGRVYVSGYLDMNEEEAKSMLENSESKFDLKDLVDKEIVDEQQRQTSGGEETHTVYRIPVFLQARDDLQSLLSAFDAEQSPMRSGGLNQKEMRDARRFIGELKRRFSAFPEQPTEE